MNPLPAPRVSFSRRQFLQLAAAFGLAGPLCRPQTTQAAPALNIASVWPLPIPHQRVSNPADFLTQPLAAYDLVLAPAYIAAELIQRALVQTLPGAPDRAHDPEGAFTRPYNYLVSTWACRGALPASLADLKPGRSLWPNFPRLALGAALQWWGVSPNTTHPGVLAEVVAALKAAAARVVRDPQTAWQAGQGDFALTLQPLAELPKTCQVPNSHAILLELDWLIPQAAPDPTAARQFLAQLPSAVYAPPPALRLTPLMPLSAVSTALHTTAWSNFVAKN